MEDKGTPTVFGEPQRSRCARDRRTETSHPPAAGDLEGARILTETIARLLGSAVRGAAVVDLGASARGACRGRDRWRVWVEAALSTEHCEPPEPEPIAIHEGTRQTSSGGMARSRARNNGIYSGGDRIVRGCSTGNYGIFNRRKDDAA